MRTLISLALLSSLFFAACGSTVVNLDDAYVAPQNLTSEWTAMQEDILDRNLEILKEEPNTTAAIQEVAFRYQTLGQYNNAVEYYQQLLEFNVNSFVALNNLADIYEKADEYDIAAEYVRRLYQENQGNYAILKDVVRIHLKADDVENAQVAIDNYAILAEEADILDAEEEARIQSLNDQVNEYLENN